MTNSIPNEKKGVKDTLPILISVIFHGVILFMLGSVVIFPGYISNALMTTNIVEPSFEIPEVPDEDIPVEPDAGGGGSPETAAMIEVNSAVEADTMITDVSVLTSSSLSAPVSLPSGGAVGTGIVGGAGGLGGGSGGGKGTGVGKGVGSGMLFGKKVVAKRLGVALDISNSMHKMLPEVLEEISNNFQDAPMMLVFGCGMGKAGEEAKVLSMKEFLDGPAGSLVGKQDTGNFKFKPKYNSREALAKMKKGFSAFVEEVFVRPEVWTVFGAPTHNQDA